MVTPWFRSLLAPKERCGPLCQDIRNEVDSIARAEALARQALKHRTHSRGSRET